MTNEDKLEVGKWYKIKTEGNYDPFIFKCGPLSSDSWRDAHTSPLWYYRGESYKNSQNFWGYSQEEGTIFFPLTPSEVRAIWPNENNIQIGNRSIPKKRMFS